ncbi:hypothetical protein CYY_004331 [Polysphondylium violaceum]|uniref:tRNA-splicing endonuclease subunit Sen34 n=1 Tax=Polysphondylium violaceum TaxID=133409 RepID=A0A8J4UZA9_9MYCE|nr:hypothetical protein CYY_004331 [Polysphondylium violaceum]
MQDIADTTNTPIDIFIVNNECLVWDEQDIFKIRTQLKLIGTLIGSLEDLKNLSTLNSIPFYLSPYEVRLGLDKGWFRIIDESKSYPIPTKESLNTFVSKRDDRIKQQIQQNSIERLKKQQEFQNEDKQKEQKEKKLKKLQLKKQKQEELNSNSSNNNISDKDKEEEQEEIKQDSNDNNNNKKQKTTHVEYINYNIPIYTSTREAIENEPESKEWRDQREKKVINSNEYYFPNNEVEKIKYKVFRDLYEKGYCLTSGLKFGGTFLAYKGDPFLYHAAYIVIIKQYDQEFQSLELIKSARLAVNVNKNILFASIDPTTNDAYYIIAEWKGVT